MLVSINGVIQKPNTGTGQPSEGFALDGANIVFAAPPPTGSDYFIITIGASVSIGTPSNDTITNAMVKANAAIAGSKLADDSISLAKLEHGTSSNNGKFLRANNGADPSYETIDLTNLNAGNLTSGTIPDARFPATLPAISGANLTGVSSPEVYGFKTDTDPTSNTFGHLKVTTTNGGVDNISSTDYDAFEDVIFAATGFTFSKNANGKLIATI